MMRNFGAIFKLVFMVTLVFALCAPATVLAKKYNLTVQSAFPRGDVSVPLLQVFADEAKRASNGDISIKWYGAPEIVPPELLMDAVNSGALDMLQSVGPYSGSIGLGDVEFGLPLAYNISWETGYTNKAKALRKLFYETGYIDTIRAEYAANGLHYIDIITAPMVILSTKPLRSLSDFKGIKIRTDGMNVSLYNAVGMSATTSVPGTEAYLGLKLGVINAAEWDISAITSLNWHEAAPYWVQGIDALVVMHTAMSKSLHDSMTPEQQAAIKSAGEAYWNAALELYEGEISEAEKLVDDGKLTKVMPDGEVLKIFHESAKGLWDVAAKKDEASQKAVAILKQWNAQNEALAAAPPEKKSISN